MSADLALEGRLRELLRPWGGPVVGFADTERVEDLPDWARRFARAVAIAMPLSRGILDQLEDGPTILYKHHYRAMNHALDRIALLTSCWLQERGHSSVPIPASVVVDWKEHLGHLSHRSVAAAAGLGWMGRSNLLVTPAWGSAVRLVTILTDAPLSPGEPLPFACGDCDACTRICPAAAIGADPTEFRRWDCLEKLREFSRSKNLGVHICGLCQKVCVRPPATKRTGLSEDQ